MPLTHLRPLCGALCTLAVASSAWAASPGWTWNATQALSHDSNLFRLPDGTWPGLTASRSDTLSTTALDLSLDQPFGRQRLSGQVGLEALRYRHHEELDHDAHHAGVRLDWETAGRLSGQLRAASARSLRPLDRRASTSSTARNLETSNEAAALVRLGGTGRLSVEGQLGGRSVNYSDPSFDDFELRTNSGSLGLRWRPGGATTWGAAWREARGHYDNSTGGGATSPTSAGSAGIDDRYRSRALDLWLAWSPGPAQRLYVRASPTRARYELREERNFSGLTGALAWQWEPRSPWRLTVRAVRDLGQDAYLERFGPEGPGAQALPGGHVDDGVVLTRWTLVAERAVSAKVQAVASFGATRRNLTTVSTATALPPSTVKGHDTTTQAALGLRWAPRRSVQLGCDASADRREADGLLSTPYSARVFGCFGRLTW